jgi:MFS transporter, AAHS family, 4-hydroxybenzoate transporter
MERFLLCKQRCDQLRMIASPRDSALDAHVSWRPAARLGASLTALAIVLDGFDNQLLGYALPAIISDWSSDRASFGWILAAGLAAMTAGTLVSGALGDRYGRKRVLLINVLLFAGATLAAAFAANVLQLGALRVVAALGLGGAMPAATALLADFTPARLQGRVVTLGIVGVPLGGILCGAFAVAVLEVHGWRTLFLLGGVLPLLLAVALLFLLRPPDCSLTQSHEESPRLMRDPSPFPLVPTIWLALAFFASLFAVYAVLGWGPSLFGAVGYTPGQASTALLMFNVGGVVGGLACSWAVDRIGAARLIPAVAIAAAALCLLPTLGAPGWMFTAAWMSLLGLCVMSAQAMLFAQAAAIYPNLIRATGIGLVLGIGRAGAITSSLAGARLVELGRETFFLAVAGALAVLALASWAAGISGKR